ncbi:MAG: hypothetical protein ACNA8H_00110 [Anaerolineales bacterium]
MSILDQLSSWVGDRSEAANRSMATQCLQNPALLSDIGYGLNSEDADLLGDCAEVMTMVAKQKPVLILPFCKQLLSLLDHNMIRVRWEAMHAVSLIARLIPQTIEDNLYLLRNLIQEDVSVIVRDHAVDAVGHYAGVGMAEAEKAYPNSWKPHYFILIKIWTLFRSCC